VAVLAYKLFNETEASLNRRLKRLQAKQPESRPAGSKPIRIWVDGCFDMMHFGHANAFRQAKALGDVLVVGINTDEEIRKHKGPPIMSEEERIIAVKACKWVDEVVTGVPYVMNDEYLQYIFKEYNIDYVVHGDDPCLLADGTDVFASAKKAGRYMTIKRTEGISTTDLVGRMLVMTREHHVPNSPDSKKLTTGVSSAADAAAEEAKEEEAAEGDTSTLPKRRSVDAGGHGSFIRSSTFMPTGRRLIQFSNNKVPEPGARIVYVDGIWDMFHAGHIKFLEECKKQGDFLYVGIFNDDVANKIRGSNYPIMNMHERALSILSCRYVDDIILNAPWVITREMLVTFNIHVVCHGVVGDAPRQLPAGVEDPYAVPRDMGILKIIPSPLSLKTQDIVDRILAQKLDFERKFAKKHAAEMAYIEKKEFVEEQ